MYCLQNKALYVSLLFSSIKSSVTKRRKKGALVLLPIHDEVISALWLETSYDVSSFDRMK